MMRAANRTIWAIVWHYSDNSGYGVLRAYASEEEARTDVNLFAPISSVMMDVVNVPMLDEREHVD
jgi:hypothetical protein